MKRIRSLWFNAEASYSNLNNSPSLRNKNSTDNNSRSKNYRSFSRFDLINSILLLMMLFLLAIFVTALYLTKSSRLTYSHASRAALFNPLGVISRHWEIIRWTTIQKQGNLLKNFMNSFLISTRHIMMMRTWFWEVTCSQRIHTRDNHMLLTVI